MPKSFSDQERDMIKNTLLERATQLMKKKDLRQITVEELARGAGISKGSFYAFFETKEQLFWAVMKQQEQQLIDEVKAIATQGESIEDKLDKIFHEIYLGKDWIINYISEESLQYLTRKLPMEWLEADRKNSCDIFVEILTLCKLDANEENVEFMTLMIQLLRLTVTDMPNIKPTVKTKAQDMLIKTITTHFYPET